MCRVATTAQREVNVKKKHTAKGKSIMEQINFNNMLHGNQNVFPLMKSKIYLRIVKGIE